MGPTRIKRTSECDARPATPSRKSRRLSGSIPEYVDSPVLPLKKRRSSIIEDEILKESNIKSLHVINEKVEETDDAKKELISETNSSTKADTKAAENEVKESTEKPDEASIEEMQTEPTDTTVADKVEDVDKI